MKLEIVDSILDCDRPDIFNNLKQFASLQCDLSSFKDCSENTHTKKAHCIEVVHHM